MHSKGSSTGLVLVDKYLERGVLGSYLGTTVYIKVCWPEANRPLALLYASMETS